MYKRYSPVFGEGRAYSSPSALAFGYMHIIFLNWIAVAMTLVGGYLFAEDYRQGRSLALVSIEHALYGCSPFSPSGREILLRRSGLGVVLSPFIYVVIFLFS
ncbi:MAG: hypothetical protein R3B51_00830 [Thermodesulfobacteriota bacterium]